MAESQSPPPVADVLSLRARAKEAREKLERDGATLPALWDVVQVGGGLVAAAGLRIVEEGGPLAIEVAKDFVVSWLEAQIEKRRAKP